MVAQSKWPLLALKWQNIFFALMCFIDAEAQDPFASDSVITDYFQQQEFSYQAMADTTPLQVKRFDTQQLSALKKSSDFQYHESPNLAQGLWNRLLDWIGYIFRSLFQGASAVHWDQVLIYALALAGFVAILLMALKVNVLKVFQWGTDRGLASAAPIHENVHEMDFEELLRLALEKEKYRDGVRLLFLYALKILSENQLISWTAGKTNRDYVQELQVANLKEDFNLLSLYFDYAWYGNFHIRKDTFLLAEGTFHTFKKKALTTAK